MSGFLIEIPVPPSVNQMYANSFNGKGRGRYKTAAYKGWLKDAAWALAAAKPEPISGPYKLLISLPNIRGDVDNRIKAINDLLVSEALVEDDSWCMSVTAEILPELEKGWAIISVEGVS